MAEADRRRIAAERLPKIELQPGIADVILAADDVGDAGLEIIDHGGEPVERPPVLADQHRIGHRRQLHLPVAEHEIVPFDRAVARAGSASTGRLPFASAAARCSGVSFSMARS